MKIIITLVLAMLGFGCIVICDFLLQNISKRWLRMGLSYFMGISIFLIGVWIAGVVVK